MHSRGQETRSFAITSSSHQQGPSIARVLEDQCLLVVAEVIQPNERTSLAARFAADTLCRHLRLALGSSRTHDALRGALHRTHAEIFQPNTRSSSIFAVAGAVSLAFTFLSGEAALVANIGSCRCYRMRSGQLSCIDRGHSASDAMTRFAGEDVSQESPDPRVWQVRDLVTEAVGLHEDIHPNIAVHDIRAGDRLLLCTSAVWASISGNDLSMAMSEGQGVERARERIAQLIAPIREDFAIAIAQVDPAPTESPAEGGRG